MRRPSRVVPIPFVPRFVLLEVLRFFVQHPEP